MARKRRKNTGEEAVTLLLLPGFLFYAKVKLHLHVSWVLIVSITAVIMGLVFLALSGRKRHGKLKPNAMDTMTGTEFELLLKVYLKKSGWRLRTTRVTGDFGADLIGTSPWGETYAIQAKRWKNRVGVEAVQQAHAAQAHYKTDKALVITNNWLTKNAREHAQAIGVEVWERPRLEREFRKANHKESVLQ